MGSIQEKLERLNATKAELKQALAEKGQSVGDVFSTYPAAVRAIATGTTGAVIILRYQRSQSIALEKIDACYPKAFTRDRTDGGVDLMEMEAVRPVSEEDIRDNLWVSFMDSDGETKYGLITNQETVYGDVYQIAG